MMKSSLVNKASSPDPTASSLAAASLGAEELQRLRETVKASGKSARGLTYLSDLQLARISELFNRDPIAKALCLHSDEFHEAYEKLCERFEELWRRTRLKEPLSRTWSFRRLGIELLANCEILGLSPKKAIAATLLNIEEAFKILLEPEFSSFAETPGIVRHAAVGYSSDPRAFLRKVEATIKEILSEPEFSNFTETPGIVRHATVGYSSDPRAFLRKVEATIKEILSEPEFSSFAETPRLVRYAAVNNASDPRAFLRTELKRRIS